MRPRGSMLSYSERRAAELYNAYKKALPHCTRADGSFDHDAAIVAAISSPSSRYWISEGVAYAKIIKIKQNPKLLNFTYPQKRLLYESLIATYDRLRADPTNAELTDTQVAYLASDSPAPSFFMSKSLAKIIIAEERKRNKSKYHVNK